MSALLASLRDIRGEFGTTKSVAIAASWLVRASFEVFVFEHGAHRDYPPVPALGSLRLTAAGESDLARMAALNPAVDERELRRRLAEGLSGTLVWEGDELVHVRWAALVDHYLPYLGLTFRLRPGDQHRMSSFTRPDRRDRGLHKALVAWGVHDSRARGVLRSIGLIATWNEPPRRSVLRAGWRPVGAIGFWRLGPFRRYVASGAVQLGPGRSFSIALE